MRKRLAIPLVASLVVAMLAALWWIVRSSLVEPINRVAGHPGGESATPRTDTAPEPTVDDRLTYRFASPSDP